METENQSQELADVWGRVRRLARAGPTCVGVENSPDRRTWSRRIAGAIEPRGVDRDLERRRPGIVGCQRRENPGRRTPDEIRRMRVLLDTNVVLDSLLGRTPWHAAADAVLEASRQGRLTCFLTALTIANMFYIGRRIVGADQARNDVLRCLRSFSILAIDRAVLDAAILLPGADFEDNIQISAAGHGALDAIVTRDPSGYAASPIRALTAEQLLVEMPAGARG